jgi:phosphoribosyl 1,2-cyclic phosphodiesterase
LQVAGLAEVKEVVTFHHDPEHSDEMLDAMLDEAVADVQPASRVTPGVVETLIEL